MNRDELMKAADATFESVVVPEWNGATFWLRTPTSVERDKYEASLLVKRVAFSSRGNKRVKHEADMTNARAKLVVLCTCTGEGDPTPFFKPGDEKWLAEKNSAAVNRLFEVAQRLAGITDEDIEEAAGN